VPIDRSHNLDHLFLVAPNNSMGDESEVLGSDPGMATPLVNGRCFTSSACKAWTNDGGLIELRSADDGKPVVIYDYE
jgi:hypothetical protein